MNHFESILSHGGHLRHDIRYKNRPLTIDTRMLDGKFESIAMRNNGDDLALVRSTSPAVAASIHANMIHSFLPENLRSLPDDLAACIAQAQEEYSEFEDWGTCNFDSPVICLPSAHAGTVEAAAALAGENCFRWQKKRKEPMYDCFVFSGPLGQGIRRTKMAERIAELLKERGYDTMVYYQID